VRPDGPHEMARVPDCIEVQRDRRVAGRRNMQRAEAARRAAVIGLALLCGLRERLWRQDEQQQDDEQ